MRQLLLNVLRMLSANKSGEQFPKHAPSPRAQGSASKRTRQCAAGRDDEAGGAQGAQDDKSSSKHVFALANSVLRYVADAGDGRIILNLDDLLVFMAELLIDRLFRSKQTEVGVLESRTQQLFDRFLHGVGIAKHPDRFAYLVTFFTGCHRSFSLGRASLIAPERDAPSILHSLRSTPRSGLRRPWLRALPQPHARAPAVFGDELDAGRLEGRAQKCFSFAFPSAGRFTRGSRRAFPRSARLLGAKARSRCAPARCAGAQAERPMTI